MSSSTRIRKSFSDWVFVIIDYFFLAFCFFIIILPLMNVVSQSLSSPAAVSSGKVFLFPVEFSLDAYSRLIKEPTLIKGFYNTIFYTFFGTLLNVCMTVMAAYPLSRRDLLGKKFIMWYFTFTMIFGGGMIPTYLLIKSLGLINTRWVMIIPGAMTVWNMIIARTFFQNTIPVELNEAAEIDGASDFKVIFSIILPLSTPIIAVLCLFYAVGHWNSFFDALIYLSSPDLFNLQLVLRNFLSNIRTMLEATNSMVEASKAAAYAEVMKYAIIVFASIPVMLLYPFAQKYFIKGIMIGTLKG